MAARRQIPLYHQRTIPEGSHEDTDTRCSIASQIQRYDPVFQWEIVVLLPLVPWIMF